MATALDQTVTEKHAHFLASFTRAEAELAHTGPAYLREARRSAIESFANLGFPGSHDEDWKFTSLNALAGIAFERAAAIDAAPERIAGLPHTANRLVFVNGYFAPRLSARTSGGVIGGSLRAALEAGDSGVEQHLARYASYRTHPFIALNTAFLEDGAFVHVPAGAVLEEPVHIVHVSTGGPRPLVSHPRNLIVVERASQAALIETYIGFHRNSYLANAVTEIVLGEDAVLDHYKLQLESAGGFHLATVQVEQGRSSTFRSHSFAFGGILARTEGNARLEEGSECTLNGLYIAGGKQHIDTRTSIDHAKPHATSHELYKGILGGESSAVFNGRIIVRKDAQKTDAKQTNKNLVLSEGATLNTKPELQIYADDVRCTHGATIGQLDSEALFYLRSRGIGFDDAREMLITAFAREITDAIRPEALRAHVERTLTARLPREGR
jgi:Fe-S cluster assembly protein SufD